VAIGRGLPGATAADSHSCSPSPDRTESGLVTTRPGSPAAGRKPTGSAARWIAASCALQRGECMRYPGPRQASPAHPGRRL